MNPEWLQAEREARTALTGRADTASLAQGSFRAIDAGLSNHAWRVTASGTDRFVRLARAGNQRFGADLAAEAQVVSLAAAAGLAPAVVRCDPAARLLVTQWIAGTDGSLGAGRTGQVIDRVAAALRQLHALVPPPGLRKVSFAQQAGRLQALLPADAPCPEFAALAPAVFARLDDPREDLVICHHDVHARNMILDADERLWLVDWEYAGLGDPLFDLASFASQADLPESAEQRLVEQYLQAGGVTDPQRLPLARWAFDYVQWLWYRTVAGGQGAGSVNAGALQRAARLEIDLQVRASGVLRCNNH
jgi:thiamine kinase-like enzyme